MIGVASAQQRDPIPGAELAPIGIGPQGLRGSAPRVPWQGAVI